MKIAHLNTHSYGGAAVVARRLHTAGLAAGIESTLITKYGLRGDETPHYVPLQNASVLYYLRSRSANAGLYRVGKTVQRLVQHKNLAHRAEGFEVFSPLTAKQHFHDCLDTFGPDIVHLHWVAGFVDHERFFLHNRARRFVWTLHDMNPITGGCHHSDGCVGYARGCSECPQLAGTIDANYASEVLRAKVRSLARLRDDQLVIVSPSRWLLELSTESKITRRFPHVLIENPGFATAAEREDQMQLRSALGLPRDKKIVLFVSDNLRNPRKGIDLLFQASRLLARKGDVQLVGLGQRTDAPADVSVVFAGRADETTLRRYYACADVLVNPSVAENASLVIIEALSCGTPVVAFATGGTPELVNENTGALAATVNAQALAVALDEALFGRHFNTEAIKAQAAKHAPALVWEKYHNVYKELVA